MKPMIFACLAGPGEAAREALLLARSIRHFAGSLAGSLIWVLFPEGKGDFVPRVAAGFQALAVRLMPFPLSAALHDFPFAAKTMAAGRAETAAEETSIYPFLRKRFPLPHLCAPGTFGGNDSGPVRTSGAAGAAAAGQLPPAYAR